MPDASLLLSQTWDEDLNGPDPTLLDYGSSQRHSSSIERARAASSALEDEDDVELDLDLGEDIATPARSGRSIEMGRDAPPPRSMRDELDDTMQLYEGDDLNLDLGEDLGRGLPRDSSILTGYRGASNFDKDGDTGMGGMDLDVPPLGDDTVFPAPFEDVGVSTGLLRRNRERDTLSPLSSLRSSVERDLEETFNPVPKQIEQPQSDEESVHVAQRAKKRRVLETDRITELRQSVINAQQEDRSELLKPISFLPKDPILLTLMNMQKNGEFASSILGDGRSRGWAPELRGILSLEVIRTSAAQLKRKRNDGAAGTSREPTPQIQIEGGQDTGLDVSLGLDPGADATLDDETIMQLPGNDDIRVARVDNDASSPVAQSPDYNEQLYDPPPIADFDETMAPIVLPQDSGPISIGTKHAVHMLRERFGDDAASSPGKRRERSVLFQDLLPEAQTTRADATKMFFEVLVLATKDAIKVEQPSDELGGPLRVKAKRGLWGSWAETKAGGEIAEQEAEAVAA